MTQKQASTGKIVIRDRNSGLVVDDTDSAATRPLEPWEFRSAEHEEETEEMPEKSLP